ncbi:UvrD-helicase domain-containing protein [Tumebacillus sp. ITR2]|uniref:DNA 3'-5' helicase n=1 Tax=Tumebacillus amylolyticus TaxID=2801339 RepID=A0ABS1JAK4_9BACL|nr:UvrD-helicase domain-containing protein [Tumebacillus amylolyticus]MBL0387270.1 UvrD-helicase domain-containing protein [Tumebacillus amylolyticus]
MKATFSTEFWSAVAAGWASPDEGAARRKRKMDYTVQMETLDGWMENIQLSSQQLDVIRQQDNRMVINGSAGSGKTLTLLYKLLRAMEVDEAGKKMLYIAFSLPLVQDAKNKLAESPKYKELSSQSKHEVQVLTFHELASSALREIDPDITKFYTNQIGIHKRSERTIQRTLAFINKFMSQENEKLPQGQRLYQTHRSVFFTDEVLWMKANGFVTEESYLNCDRIGRGSVPRLTKEQRKTIFKLFQEYHRDRDARFGNDRFDAEDYAIYLLEKISEMEDDEKYDYIFADEMQDLQPMQILALHLLCKSTGKLILAGDPKQRIYKRSPVTLRHMDIDVEGRRTRYLKVNHRSTKQIMRLAGSLDFQDTDNDREEVRHMSLREGDKPLIRSFKQDKDLASWLVKQIEDLCRDEPSSRIAIVHRFDDDAMAVKESVVHSELQKLFYVRNANEYHRFVYKKNDRTVFFADAFSVKGLEFDYVFLLHFDKHHYPHKREVQKVNERFHDDRTSEEYMKDLHTVHNDEKKVLYVALTRARRKVALLFTGDVKNISPYVREFVTRDYEHYGFNKRDLFS